GGAVLLDLAGDGAVGGSPDGAEDAAAEGEAEQCQQREEELAGVDGDAEGAKEVGEGERLALIDSADHQRFIRHELSPSVRTCGSRFPVERRDARAAL